MIRLIDHNFKPDLIASGFTPCSACVIVLRVRPSASLAPEIENRFSSEPRFSFADFAIRFPSCDDGAPRKNFIAGYPQGARATR
jgi:hypothetical protein